MSYPRVPNLCTVVVCHQTGLGTCLIYTLVSGLRQLPLHHTFGQLQAYSTYTCSLFSMANVVKYSLHLQAMSAILHTILGIKRMLKKQTMLGDWQSFLHTMDKHKLNIVSSFRVLTRTVIYFHANNLKHLGISMHAHVCSWPPSRPVTGRDDSVC